eukprot:Sdes_comp17763_c0_seq2m7030
MKPISLHGHERSITQIKFNREGDLLFSVAKDNRPTVWYSHNGERLGTYNGHTGAVYTVDVNHDSSLLLTGGADNQLKLWNVCTGEEYFTWQTKTAVRRVGFSLGGTSFMYTTDKMMGHPSSLNIVKLNLAELSKQPTPHVSVCLTSAGDSKITAALWGPLDKTIVTGHENGTLCCWEPKTGELLQSLKPHQGPIVDIQTSSIIDSFFITASKDFCAKLFNSRTLEELKTYKTDKPVNSASISSLKDHVVLCGGQEARDVTTTSTRIGKFDSKFFHLVLMEEIGTVKGHFGPVNSVAFHPSGKMFATGGEDGYVRMNYFDEDYFDFEFEY